MALSAICRRRLALALTSEGEANELADALDGLTDGGIATTDLDLGASGTAGSLDVFPATASKGKLRFVAADSTGDTTTTVTNAAQSAAATMTIPDTNGSASFVMTAASQTISGAKTFTGGITVTTTNATITDKDVVLSATTGTKIGTATTQKLGFWNATPIVQPSGAAQAALTDSSGGTADGTISAVGNTMSGDVSATINNNFAELATLLGAIRTALVNTGIIKGAA